MIDPERYVAALRFAADRHHAQRVRDEAFAIADALGAASPALDARLPARITAAAYLDLV